MGENFKTASRREWSCTGEKPDMDDLTLGALLRIADASENMAREHSRLIASEKFERNRANRLAGEIQYLERRVAALKGVITKMKAKEARNG